VRVEIGGKLFHRIRVQRRSAAVLLSRPRTDGTEMTRNYPMKKGVAGEVEDHPHHRSLWFTHGDVNGIDFWAEGGDKRARSSMNPSSTP
jgi:hypothetical protein